MDETVGGVVRFGASSEEAVSEVADHGLQLSDLLFESVFALSSTLMEGLVVMGLLAEGDSLEAVRAGLVGSVTSRTVWGEFGEQGWRGGVWLVDGGRIIDEGNRTHPRSMTAAQLQAQVSRMGSPIIYNSSNTTLCLS